MNSENPKPDRCPLCAGPNHCAVAAGEDPANCWCMTHTINPQAKATSPDNSRCLCAQCGSDQAYPA